ncbi:hypothetical protein AC249_AIPGENE6191 [Exaiptasia diaphana]|nr:hypothetical protein AC249_AIPGENE6191 [Exaiptasia diaphana]
MQPKEIAELLCLGRTYVHTILKCYRETKGVDEDRALRVRGRHRVLSARDLIFIRRIISQYPELYLDEVRDWLQFQTGRLFALSTISRTLRKMGLSIVKLQIIAKQRDEMRRAQYRRFISQFQSRHLLFIDESAKDERTYQRKYGLGLTGKRVSRKGNFTRGTRYSILAAIAVDGVRASHSIVGSYNREQFEFAMEQFVIPHVGSYAQDENCSIVVFDNCNIHRSDRVFELIRQRGGMSVFLPPYSPDMNPIEECFGVAKAWLKRHQDLCQTLPKRCFERALEEVSQDSCTNFFTSCGYT